MVSGLYAARSAASEVPTAKGQLTRERLEGNKRNGQLRVAPMNALSIADPDAVIAVLQAHAAELRAAGIRHLSLFGSVARGDAGPESDIDLAAEIDRNAGLDLFGLIALERQLGEMLGRKVDLTLEPAEKQRLQANINRDRRRAF